MPIRQALEKLAKAGIDLKEETVAILFGGLDVPKLKSESDSLYRKYGVSGNIPHRPEELDKQFDEMRQEISRVGIRTTASFLGMKAIQDKYQYEKIPAFQTAAKVGSDFTAKMMDAMQAREQMKLEYTQMAHNAITGIAVAAQASKYLRSVRAVGTGRVAAKRTTMLRRGLRSIAAIRKGMQAARAARNAFAAAFTAGTGGAGLLPSAVAIVLTEVAFIAAGKVAERLVEFAFKGRLDEAFKRTFAGSLLDANVLSEFEQRTRFMPGFTFENVKDIQSRARRFGATEEEITGLAGYASNRIAGADRDDYAEAMYMDSRFFGVEESSITSIYGSLGNIGGGNKPVEQAKNEFERFFTAVAGNASPNIAEIGMVKDLTSFAESYSFAGKMVMDVAALTNIQGFMGRSGFGNMLTTAPTQNLVKGLDSALLGSAAWTNVSMVRFNARYGISMTESLQGITSNTDTLNKFLHGLVSEVGISSGGLTEDSTIRLYRMLNAFGVDADTTQIITRLLPGFLRGERVTAVEAGGAFEEYNEYDETSTLLNYYKRLSDDDLRVLEINVQNAGLAIDVASATMTAYTNRFIEIVAGYGDLSLTARRALQMPGTGTTTFSASTSTRDSVAETSGTNISRTYNAAIREAYLNSEVSFGPGIEAGPVRNFIENNPNYQYVVEAADRMGVRPEDLAAIIGFETGYTFSPAEENTIEGSTATGLIQFIEDTAEGLGTSTAALKAMTFEEQMEYVVKHLEQHGVGDKYFTIADMYLAVFQPARLGDEVIIRANQTKKMEDNKILDYDKSGHITYSDLLSRFGGPRNIMVELETDGVRTEDAANAILEHYGNR